MNRRKFLEAMGIATGAAIWGRSMISVPGLWTPTPTTAIEITRFYFQSAFPSGVQVGDDIHNWITGENMMVTGINIYPGGGGDIQVVRGGQASIIENDTMFVVKPETPDIVRGPFIPQGFRRKPQ